MDKRALGGALLFAVIAIAGCSDDGKYLTGPDAIVWNSQEPGRFSVRGNPKMTGEFGHDGAWLKVTLWGFPKGLTVQLGDRRDTVGEQGSAAVSYNASALFAKLPADSMEKAQDLMNSVKLDPGLSMVLTPKGRAAVSVPLPALELFESSIESLFDGVADQKGVRFGDEQARKAEPPHSIISVSPGLDKVFGTAATLGDIDAVAITKMLPQVKGTKSCGGFVDDNGRPVPPLQLQLKESEVSIYDRRTGALLETRRFPPSDTCPSQALVHKGRQSTDSDPPRDAIYTWLSAWVSGQRPAAQAPPKP